MSSLLLAALAGLVYQVDAKLDPLAGSLRGRVEIQVRNGGDTPISYVDLWLYPNRFATAPENLRGIDFHWVYPRSFDPGNMRITDPRVDGLPTEILPMSHPRAGQGTSARVTLPSPLPPGAAARLTMAFSVRIPRRFGSFGCLKGTCTLAQGWYPLVVGEDTQGMPPRARHRITVESPWPTVIGGAITAALEVEDESHVPLVAYERPRVLEVKHRGIRIRYLSRFPPVPDAKKRIPYGFENYYRIGVAAAKKALDLWLDLGMEGTPDLTLCEVPIRGQEIAQAQGAVVLVSDLAWRMLPLARFRKFHTFQVARAIYGTLIERRARSYEDVGDLAWSPDAGASFLVELLTLREYGRVEFARDVLDYFSFVPEIDSLIYAPKVAFTSAYFGSADDPDRLRDDLRRFNNELPKGKRLYEKLKDLLDTGQLLRAMRGYVIEKRPFRRAAEDAAGRPLDAFFEQWLGAYPFVHYEVVAVESLREGDAFVHHVRVRKHGDVVEPVRLWARDEAGKEWTLRWDGEGAEHDFTFRSRSEIDVAHLDPRERLIENWPGRPDDLKLDNRRPAEWKLLFYGFSALLDVLRLQPAFGADFALRRKHDLERTFWLGFFRSETTDGGAVLGYVRSFGAKVDENRRAAQVGASLSGSRLNREFTLPIDDAFESRPGTRVGVSLSLGYDDRVWQIMDYRGIAASLNLGTQTMLLDQGTHLQTYSLGGWAARLWAIAPAHVVLAALSSVAVAGDIELTSQLVHLGGPGGLVGYEPDELRGRGAAIATLEYRHTFIRGLDWNVLHIARGRGFSGAIFFNVATLATPTELDEGWFAEGQTFFHAGYSLRGHFDWLGVSQALVRADLGVPINRPESDDSRPPFGFVIAFGPSF